MSSSGATQTAPTLPQDYWASYEHRITSLDEYFEAVRLIAAFQRVTDSRFAWRGVVNADWALHSSLVRRYMQTHSGSVPTEHQQRTFERGVLAEAHEWALDWHAGGGRLSALELLAAMQHYGVPTRLLDFTFDPFVALWFAVERDDAAAGRIFAVDIAGQIVVRSKAASTEPWWYEETASTASPWSTRPWIWTPPPFEPRIVRQKGCFVMGGIPSTQPARNLRVGMDRPLRATEIRACMSVPLVLINYSHAEAAAQGRTLAGRPPRASAFTLRIELDKAAVRAELDQLFGHSHRLLFPDLPGLARWGQSFQ